MKNKIREWAFPVVLIVSWVCASAYTVSRLVEAHGPAAAAVVSHA